MCVIHLSSFLFYLYYADTVASNWSWSKRDFNMAVGNLSLDYPTIFRCWTTQQ